MKSDHKPPFLESPRGLYTAIGLIILIWLLWAFIAPFAIDGSKGTLATQGQFGDMFGALNTLFAGLAFAALMHTVFIQRAEMREAQRDALESKAQAHAERFEATFFQLVRTFNEIIESFSEDKKTNSDIYSKIQGREVLLKDANALLREIQNKSQGADDLPRIEAIKQAYKSFYGPRETRLAHYFRMLYRIIKWIELAPESDRKFYGKTIRAQLSSQELVILMYNCLYEYGEDMKPLVEKYSLLKHTPRGELLPDEDRKNFSETAFKDQ